MTTKAAALPASSFPRRLTFWLLVSCTGLVNYLLLSATLQDTSSSWSKSVLMFLFVPLSIFLSMWLWTAMVGFAILHLGRRRFRFDSEELAASARHVQSRTAIVMPIYNEDVARVFAGARSIYESLERAGCLAAFDLFLLSDSTDPDKWVEEELHWSRLVREVGGEGRVFYRRRPQNTSRKSGNITDFCENWGSLYDYMVVLDADSLISGATLAKLVRLMEDNPRAGIIQTAPR